MRRPSNFKILLFKMWSADLRNSKSRPLPQYIKLSLNFKQYSQVIDMHIKNLEVAFKILTRG